MEQAVVEPTMPNLNGNRVFEVKKSQIQQTADSGQTRPQSSAMNHWVSRGAAAIAVFTGLALIATPANARWYKWVDQDGKKYFVSGSSASVQL